MFVHASFAKAVMRGAVAKGLVGLLLLACASFAAAAQERGINQFSRSYITPFPAGNNYRLVVLGDSLGDGIWAGLYRVFKEDGNVEVIKKSKVSTGFSRPDYYDWNAALDDILRSETVHIAVMMVGANDLQSINVNRRWYRPGSEEWRQAYGERVDRFMKRLKQSKAAVYWVGLPIMRSDDFNRGMQVMNEIFREKAFLNGIKFIDTWNGFADEFGRYSAYGPDLSGQVRRLRAEDGVHFTMSGYVKLAHFVEREIRRDLHVARAERNIPLAGSEEEQARTLRRANIVAQPIDRAAIARPRGEQPVATARTIAPGVEVVRPYLGPAAAAAVPPGYSPPGETIAHDLSSEGLTALTTISPMNDPTLLSGPQQLPLDERPYYRVLVHGEQLDPKPSRADDFSWPGG